MNIYTYSWSFKIHARTTSRESFLTSTIKIVFYVRSSFETLGESNACRNTLERKLTLKSNELQGFRDNFKELESQNQSLKSKLEDAKKTIREQEDKLRVLTDERNDLERNFTIHLTENNVGFFVSFCMCWFYIFFVLPGVQGLFSTSKTREEHLRASARE